MGIPEDGVGRVLHPLLVLRELGHDQVLHPLLSSCERVPVRVRRAGVPRVLALLLQALLVVLRPQLLVKLLEREWRRRRVCLAGRAARLAR